MIPITLNRDAGYCGLQYSVRPYAQSVQTQQAIIELRTPCRITASVFRNTS